MNALYRQCPISGDCILVAPGDTFTAEFDILGSVTAVFG
jgi:hypothetical protein